MDALDGCLIDFSTQPYPQVLAKASRPWGALELRLLRELTGLERHSTNLTNYGRAGNLMAIASREVVNELLHRAAVSNVDVIAIGSHGQTVMHRPDLHFSVQLDNAPYLAALTGIDVVSNFRSADLAHGGEGAPLTPAFHAGMFAQKDHAALVLNLGGIANLTVINAQGEVVKGYDTGPANTLMDLTCRTLLNIPYDQNGEIARSGQVQEDWLSHFLSYPYFRRPAPKSTGTEEFGAAFIAAQLQSCRENRRRAQDLLRTLLELTAQSALYNLPELVSAGIIDRHSTLIVCGGGAFNTLLMERLTELAAQHSLKTVISSERGIDPQLIECAAFAWLARRCCLGIATDLRSVSGARECSILGTLSPALHGHYQHQCLNHADN